MVLNRNLQIVEQIYDDFGKGNISGVLNKLSNDIIWVDPGNLGNLYKGTRKGKSEVESFFKILGETIDVTSFDVINIIPNISQVIAIGKIGGKAKTTGKSIETDWAMQWVINNDKVTYHQLYLDTNAIANAIN